LFQASDPAAIDAVCARSPVGKLLPDDLYDHLSALPALEPVLRVYEGCGRAFLGEVEGANLIKIHRRGKMGTGTVALRPFGCFAQRSQSPFWDVGQVVLPGLPGFRDRPAPGAAGLGIQVS
jgi:hypothetical protein